MAQGKQKTKVVFANRYTAPNGDTYRQGRWYEIEPREARELIDRGKVRAFDPSRDKDVKRGTIGDDPSPSTTSASNGEK